MNLKLEIFTLRINRWYQLVFLNVLLMIGFTFAGNEVQTSSPDTVPDFTLKDANQKDFRLAEHRGKIMVLSLIPDTKSKKQGAHWLEVSRQCLQQLRQKFGDSISVLGIKEMTDLPFFLPKSFIRAKLRQEPVRYLIDWQGDLFDRLAVGTAPLLIVVDSRGEIVLRQPLSSQQDICNDLCTNIEALIVRQAQTQKQEKQ